MAAVRKRFTFKAPAASREDQYADFLLDMLSGKIAPERLIESNDGRGRLVLDYDEPQQAGVQSRGGDS